MVQNDDDAWRAIVDNYGDRPDLQEQAGPSDDLVEADPEDVIGPPRAPAREPTWDEVFPESPAAEDRFVPPPPPPLPTTTTDRLIAWLGVFGSPTILLVCLVLGIRPPELITYVLVLGFVGGFLYLVVKMNREPRDPDDNGAVV